VESHDGDGGSPRRTLLTLIRYFKITRIDSCQGCPSFVLNNAASAEWCFVPLAIYPSDTRRLVWLLRRRSAFFGMGNQGREPWVAVQCREIRIVLQMESNIRSQPVVDCLAQK
jgi:hypothetical protein